MSILDWILIAWIVAAFFVGARLGLVYHLGSLIGLFIGLEIAGRIQQILTDQGEFGATVQFIVFTLIVIGVAIAIGFTAKVLDKMFKFISWIPFMKTINGLGGAIIAMAVDLLFTGTALYVLTHIPIADVFSQTIAESTIAQFLIQIGMWVALLLPGIVL